MHRSRWKASDGHLTEEQVVSQNFICNLLWQRWGEVSGCTCSFNEHWKCAYKMVIRAILSIPSFCIENRDNSVSLIISCQPSLLKNRLLAVLFICSELKDNKLKMQCYFKAVMSHMHQSYSSPTAESSGFVERFKSSVLTLVNLNKSKVTLRCLRDETWPSLN